MFMVQDTVLFQDAFIVVADRLGPVLVEYINPLIPDHPTVCRLVIIRQRPNTLFQ